MSSPFTPAEVAADFNVRFDATLRLMDMPQKKLAAQLGIHYSTVHYWTKTATPSQILFDKLCEILGEEAKRYLTGKSNKPPALVVKS